MTRAYDRTIRDNRGLTIEQIGRYTPAVLATQPWHEVTNRYSYISTTDVIDELNRAGYACVSAMQSNSRIADKSAYTKHQLTFRAVDKLGYVDEVPEINIINDHSASAAYSVMAAYFRLICANGLVLVDTASDILKVRHTGTVVQEVLNATFAIAQHMDAKLAAIAQMKRIMLTDYERMHLAEQVAIARYGQTVEGSLVEYKDQVKPRTLLVPRRQGDRELDLWHTYNVCQFNAINGGVCLKGWDRARKVTALDSQLKINLAAWQVAQELRVAHVG